jgi:hypothetical protein
MGVTAVKDPLEDCYSDRPRENDELSCQSSAGGLLDGQKQNTKRLRLYNICCAAFYRCEADVRNGPHSVCSNSSTSWNPTIAIMLAGQRYIDIQLTSKFVEQLTIDDFLLDNTR